MNNRNNKRVLFVVTLVFLAMFTSISYSAPGGGSSGPFGKVIAILEDPDIGLFEIKREVKAIESEITNPEYGLAEIKREVQAIEGYLFPEYLVRSSGLFGLPANANSVDWFIVNNSTIEQTVIVTVYKAGVGPKTIVPPGALTVVISPGEVTHNANSVGYDKPFVPGFYYEVVVEGGDTNVLPSVSIWDNFANQNIPGTLISPGNWVTLR